MIERIFRHCGLWEGSIRTLASPRRRRLALGEPPTQRDLELVLDAEFLESQRLETRLECQLNHARELQLVLDPEYL